MMLSTAQMEHTPQWVAQSVKSVSLVMTAKLILIDTRQETSAVTVLTWKVEKRLVIYALKTTNAPTERPSIDALSSFTRCQPKESADHAPMVKIVKISPLLPAQTTFVPSSQKIPRAAWLDTTTGPSI